MGPDRAVISTLLILAAVLTCPAAGGAQPDALRQVQDPRQRFTISIPAAWEVRTSTGDPAVEASSPPSPGDLPDTVNVIVRDLPWFLTPQACIGKAIQIMRIGGTQFKTLDEHPEELGGLHAYVHAYTWRTRSGADRRSYQVCAMLTRRAFLLIGTTANSPSHVRDNLPVLERIMDTFRPKGVPRLAPEKPTPDPGDGDAGNR